MKEARRLGLVASEDYDLAVDIQSVGGMSLIRERTLSQEKIAALIDACTNDATAIGFRDAAMLAALSLTRLL